MNRCRPLRKRLHHFLLIGRRLHHHRFVVRGRSGQIQLISRLDVRNFLEKVHQLREVEELRKARPRPIARPFRSEFNRGRGFPESGSPRIKMRHAFLLQCAVLQIALHSVQLGHAVADRRTRCKHNALAAGDFVHISAFQEHIR